MVKQIEKNGFGLSLEDYRGWTGSRLELISLLSNLEQADPKNRMLFTKKSPKKMLAVNSRRIQWFIRSNIMPKPKGQTYSYAHVTYYWAAIFLRKQKLTFAQIEKLLNEMSLDAAEDFVTHGEVNIKTQLTQKQLIKNLQPLDLAESLQKMGRAEGRPLKTSTVKLAITPWCQVMINETDVHKLTPHNIEVIVETLRLSLNELSN